MPVAFRVSSPLAMFRKWWTTTSSVSYPFPPPTAVAGLIGAILGFERTEDGLALYWDQMKGSSVAIVIEHYAFLNMAVNFVNTKDYKGHTQIMHQFVRNGSYIIFYKGPLENQLREYLEDSRSHFTPYLGVAYAIANIEFVDYYPTYKKLLTHEVHSVLPFTDEAPHIDITKTGGVFRERMDLKLTRERKREEMINVVYSSGPLYLKEPVEAYELGNYNIVWFPEW